MRPWDSVTATLERVRERRPDDSEPVVDGDAPEETHPPQRRLLGHRPSDAVVSWIGTLVVTGVAAVLRLWDLGSPKGLVFDEVYYVPNSQELLDQGYENNIGRLFVVHPPFGKWMIAAGQFLFDENEFGWRFSSAVAGSLCVLILIRVVRRMTRSTLLGVAAGLLLALDGLSLVQSRIGLLDIFLALFVLAGFACLVVDRDRVRERLAVAVGTAPDDRLEGYGPGLGPRPWRLAGGILLGLACGVKWSGLPFLVGFAVLSILWDRAARRTAGVARPTVGTTVRDLPGWFGSLVVAPVVAYVATWAGWFLGENSYNRHWGETHEGYWWWLGSPLRGLIKYHSEAYEFHRSLNSSHPYESRPWSWLVTGRPVSYYYPSGEDAPTGCGAETCVRAILAVGTPALWWVFVPAVLWMLWWLVSRRDWRAAPVLVAFLAGWVFWLYDGDRTMFLFYMTPLVPFLVMGVAFALGDVLGRAGASETRRTVGLMVVCGYLALVVVNFGYLHPILTADLITYDEWRSRMWFSSWI